MPKKSTPTESDPKVSLALKGKIVQRKRDKKVLPLPDLQNPQSVLDPRKLLDIPWLDVTVLKHSSNSSKDDPIVIGPDATAALERLYLEFGITGMPDTWGQVMGSVSYCTELNSACNYPRYGKKDDEEWFSAVLKVAHKYNPDLVDSIVAYHDRDIKKLRELFIANIGFAGCSKHFDPDLNWDSFPD
jgi:hypothetical protein